ncbi:MAG TPA: hypothetical protein VGV41_01215 [Pseudolabrys sp.]|jgi:predicted DNA-binding transcriptional regulator AlpA|uniref:hypothetical protein n=1 Tax=Pseudolabrys sp. TaxID=1960880 RepID=UPI002DDCF1A1|nr:hypothetical protein [Pseudolabrys sp.]HEV2627251.1 hypothetical protein [Pseudolabrys sp.]
MKTFEFAIIASGLDPNADDFESIFYNNGCDDALVAFQKGHTIIDFARQADSIDEAIASAIENVCATGATIERVEPDPLVNLSDIASRTGLTRAAVSNYAKGLRSKNFPAPVVRVTSDSPLWDWTEVSHWMFKNKSIGRDEAVIASVVKEANVAIEAGDKNIRNRLKQRADLEEATLEAA